MFLHMNVRDNVAYGLKVSQANLQWLDVSARHQTARWAGKAMIPLHDTVAGGV